MRETGPPLAQVFSKNQLVLKIFFVLGNLILCSEGATGSICSTFFMKIILSKIFLFQNFLC